MPRPEKAYESVIIAIHGRRKVPFAIWEVAYETGFSRQTVARVFDRLLLQGWIQRDATPHFNNRVWRTRKRWPAKVLREVKDYYTAYQIAAGDRTVSLE